MGILCGLAGCAPESAGSSGGGASGTGTATARGNGGDVEVTVTVKDGAIAEVEALGPKETQGIGSRATEWLPGRMVEANSVEVDGITGATISSNAVLIAAKEAYGQAIGQPIEHAAPQDGRFVSSCMGMMGNVYVATTFEGGAIKEVRFLSSNETEHLSFAAIERIPAKIQGEQLACRRCRHGRDLHVERHHRVRAQVHHEGGRLPARLHGRSAGGPRGGGGGGARG